MGQVIVSVVTSIVTAVLFWVFAKAQTIPESFIPSKAVMAFDQEQCPAGWDEFAPAAGRTVIGTGAGPGLSVRNLRQAGGTEKHQLTIAEMPRHNHAPPGRSVYGGSGTKSAMGNTPADHSSGYVQVEAQGDNQPHENMQPFVALKYCVKK